MKKIVLLLCAVAFLAGCSKNIAEEEYDVPGVKLPKTGNYFCPPKSELF